jgi:ferredoxin-NADP reductase/MOSC domain-containing protein YiiM
MARLLSVNVGMPRDVQWQGRTVHTGIWKDPVAGRCRVGRLNVEGDGQGDLGGHGGVNRAVFVYQMESIQYWRDALQRPDLDCAHFGENFTIEGLPDTEVCIGDRFRIGSALFEVSQPRVTCYRVGLRTGEPRMPALLTSSGRPGYYFRVLQEGEVGAGDEIVKGGEAAERMTVAEVNALLYTSAHPQEQLQRVLRIEALSPGWRGSFEQLLRQSNHPGPGNAGLAPAGVGPVAVPGFRPLMVASLQPESDDVLSVTFQSTDGLPLPQAAPGQFVVVRFDRKDGAPPLFRSYSLSGAPSTERYRISVKLEPHGQGSRYVHENLRVGDIVGVSAPRGAFSLRGGDTPVALLSAGIGATPVLAMLNELAHEHSRRQVIWIHSARDGRHHPFATEASALLQALPDSQVHICYSRPAGEDRLGADYERMGRLSLDMLRQYGLPATADVYLCGPTQFMADMQAALSALGFDQARVHSEAFGGGESLTPGIAATPPRTPHLPADQPLTGPLVSFARSGIATRWNAATHPTLLELAEACDIPVRWSCRAGVCHNCETGLVAGSVDYDPIPLDAPAPGNLLLCCGRPRGDVVIDA